jgi:hypothetical protein
MSIPAGTFAFFSLTLIAALFMITEGGLILFLKKQFTPLPTRVLAGLSRLVAGRRSVDRTTSRQLFTYASCDLMFGTMILISSFVYLFEAI